MKLSTSRLIVLLITSVLLLPAAAIARKPPIIEFWATWYDPCIQNIPHLNELHAKYKDQGLGIIGITDEEHQKVRIFMKDNPIRY